VVGWLRPIVLVPIGVLTGFPAEHLEALLLHELAHVRRRDYLVNMLQSIAETLLFYHPAVWWISGHIRMERELCCDDLAVAATGDAYQYALALAGLEACRPAHIQTAMAANGGRLADRIARLLGKARPETRSFSAPGAASAILLAITACVMFAQPADRPKFEVASIKPAPENTRFASSLRPLPSGRLHAGNLSVRMLISSAYHLQNFQIAGAPAWANTEGFDIEATAGSNATREQLMLMLQSLLEERFQLKYHRETRDVPAYALVVGRGGPKLPAPKEGGCKPPDPNAPLVPGPTSLPPCGTLATHAAPNGWTTSGGDLTMSDLIQNLSLALGRPVLDRTGITTRFDVRFEFTPDEATEGLTKGWGSVQGHSETMAAAAAQATTNPQAAPSILVALPQQLGLRLESTKGPGEVMVIDRVERPSAN
jgi:uncharacterized protein (TIGR03435 family)